MTFPAPSQPQIALPPRVVLYDGTCAVCDAWVQWILNRDPNGAISFAALQGDTAAEIVARHPELPENIDSLILVIQGETERVLWYSDAFAHTAAALPAPYSALRWIKIVPRPLRDLGYRAFAAVRLRVFGTVDSCRLPQPHEMARFLA